MISSNYFADDPRSNRERMLAGDLYIADDPENERIARRATALVDAYQRAVVGGEDAKAREILGHLLGTLGEARSSSRRWRSTTARTSTSAPGRSSTPG